MTPTQRQVARRAELLAAVIAAIREDGPALSMEAMAARAGTTKPILYRHFTDRGGLYAALVDRFTSELAVDLEQALRRDPENADSGSNEPFVMIDRAIDVYLRFIERDLNMYRFLVQRAAREFSGAHYAIDDFVRTIARLISENVKATLADAGRDTRGADAWGHGIVGMVNAIGDWWLDHQELTRDEVREYAVTLAWHGLRATGLGARPNRERGSASP